MHDDEDDEDTVIRPRRAARHRGPGPVPDAPARVGAHETGRALHAAAPDDEDVADTVLRQRGPSVGDTPDDLDDTVVRPARSERAERTAAAGDDLDARDDLDDTVLRPGRSRRGVTGPGTAAPATGGRPDGRVRTGAPAPAGAAAPAGTAAPAGAPAPVPGRSVEEGGLAAGAGAGLQAGSATTERVPSIRLGERVIRLDRTVIVGRRPAPPRIPRGDPPELVTVRSPRQEVSSSHLAVSAAGTAVVVEDLGSTNGTVIRPLGAAPIRMPSGGSMVVLTGTVVEIGDGNSIEILSPHLRVHPQAGDHDRADPWYAVPDPRHAPTAESDPDT